MTDRDVQMNQIEVTDLDPGAADELFSVVDVLEVRPSLRRALSDPTATTQARQQLATRLFSQQISSSALAALNAVVEQPFAHARDLPSALETQALRALLERAVDEGQISQVQHELHSFARTVDRNASLSDALRNRSLPVENRKALVSRLTQDKVLPISQQLILRASDARSRNISRTIDGYLELAASLIDEQVARVTVAKPLSEEHQARLQQALEAQVGRSVSLQIDIDPRILGGIEVQLGNEIIESSVAGRLDQARRLLKTSPSKVGRNG